jgi:hypothetical protein
MTTRSANKFQFASDIDGDLHLFPKNLDEPDYQARWQVWVRLTDGTRKEAVLDSPIMSVRNGRVMNPYCPSGHQKIPGWFIDFFNASEIEVSIDSGPVIRISHPRPS